MSNPLISIIIPVYNGEKFLRETIESVLNQTYENFELIIVNDGSTDSSKAITSSYKDSRIVSLNLEQNRGVSNARNMGIALSKGEYIAFCDADDLCIPERLQCQLDYLLRHPSVDICGSAYIIFSENCEEELVQPLQTDQEIKEYFFKGNCMGQPTIMGKAAVFRKYQYNPELVASEDYDLWARMSAGGVIFANLSSPLIRYRAHATQASKTKAMLLDRTAKAVCANYAVIFLDSSRISEYANSKELSFSDFEIFVKELAITCGSKSKDINTFRSLIALQCRKLNVFGISAFIKMVKITVMYKIRFPSKYLLNLFLLSLLSIKKDSSLFNTLTKLKI